MAGMIGTMEDTGDTYPVCDNCGYVGTMRTRDGDECVACRDAQPVRLPGGAH